MEKRAFKVTQVLTCLILFLLVGCTFSNILTPTILSTEIPTITPTVSPTIAPNAITVKNQQGFPLTLRSVFREGDYIKAVFCFLMPTSDDWQLGSGYEDVLIFSGEHSSIRTSGGIASDGGSQDSKRCLYALFPAPEWQDNVEVKITVSKIGTSMPEVPDCKKAQERLDQKLIPIKIACNRGDHSFHWEVSEKPANIPMEKAREIAYDEGLSNTIIGPWTFTTKFFASSTE